MIKRLFVIVSILFTVITSAQEGTSSPYSFYGIGLTTFKGTVENRSMGGISVFSDSIHVNLTNPAAFGDLRLTTYTVGGTHSSIDTKNATQSEASSVATFDYLAVGLPVGKWAFGFGLVPQTSVGYNLVDIDQENGTAGRFTGKGGLNQVFLSAGIALGENFRFGAEVDYGFGNIENKSVFVREGLQFGSREVNESRLSGFSYKFALNFQKMLNDRLQLRASGIFSPESKLASEDVRQLATVAVVTNDQEIVSDFLSLERSDSEFIMPSEFTFGLGLGQPRKWFVGGEYTTRAASGFNNRSFAPEGATYTEASSYRLGGFYIPRFNSPTSYFSRIVYRAGFRMEETGLELQGEAINEFGISFGVGLPVGRVFSNANLGFEYGQRGTTNAGLIQEDFVNLSISLSLNDQWFQKRRFE